MAPEYNSKVMMIESIHPGVELDRVKEATGFELIIPDFIPTTPPPSDSDTDSLFFL